MRHLSEFATLLTMLSAMKGSTDTFRFTYLGRSSHDFLSKAAGEAGAKPDGVPDLQFHLEGLHEGKQIQDVRVHYPPYDYNWSTSSTNWWATAMLFDAGKFVRGARYEDGLTTLHGPIVATTTMELFITEYPGEFRSDQFEVLVLYMDGSVQPVGEGLALYVGSDVAGHFVGVATYGGKGGGRLGRENVTVSAAAVVGGKRRELRATTDAEGMFSFPVADLIGATTRGTLTFAARQDEEETTVKAELSDLPLRLTPRPVAVTRGSSLVPKREIDLTGQWRFAPDPPGNFYAADHDVRNWMTILVPGHWVQQGFHSEHGVGGYRRVVRVPESWTGQRVKLSFDGVYSGAEVWVNGERAGSHEGGATPFELDVTGSIRYGKQNLLAVRVTERTDSSRLDKMSQYAHFPLTGIYRKARLFAVPPVHLARLHAETLMGTDGAKTRLILQLSLVNESPTPVGGAVVRLSLTGPEGKPVNLHPNSVEATLGAWDRVDRLLEIPVASPVSWDAEHPRLHTLVAEVTQGGRSLEQVRKHIGFRQAEIRGTEFHVNGRRVTLRGTCRHDTYPSTGRSVTRDLLQQDFELMRQANLNAVRTSHYPPAPELLDLADEMGFYVEEEAPFCWVNKESALLSSFPTILQRTAEMLERDRSHASVIFWSQANESAWGKTFDLCVRSMRKLDATRPWAADGTTTLDIATYHNPTLLQGVLDSAKADRPVLAGEALCIYQGIGPNGEELETDPGIRDYYVVPLIPVREAIVKSPTHLGTMIWCWADDVFQVPYSEPQNQVDEYGQRARPDDVAVDFYRQPGKSLVGYPPWGVVDGWRRKRPEWWLVKKLYSPIKIAESPLTLPPPGEPLRIEVENRYDHTNLSEIRGQWRSGNRRGTLHLNVPPRGRGVTEIPLPQERDAGIGRRTGPERRDGGLHLEFYDRRGWLVDAYHLRFPETTTKQEMSANGPNHSDGTTPTILEEEQLLTVRGRRFAVGFDRTTGQVRSATMDEVGALLEGPTLHLLSLADAFMSEPDPKTWTLRNLQTHVEGSRVHVVVAGTYTGFEGQNEWVIDDAGGIEVHYRFLRTGPDLEVREMGLRFAVPMRCDMLRWRRRGEFSVYPEDHIGRSEGETRAFAPNVPCPSFPAPGVPPRWLWSEDCTPAGSNDFRSTKRNLLFGSLTGKDGRGVRIDSNGEQHLRCAVEGDRIAVYVNDWYGGTNCRGFFEWQGNYGTGKVISTGTVIEGTVRLQLMAPMGFSRLGACIEKPESRRRQHEN